MAVVYFSYFLVKIFQNVLQVVFFLESLKLPRIPATAGFSRKSFGRNDGWGVLCAWPE